MKIKVLILSTSLGLGGGDREVVQIATNLRNRGHQVKIIAMVSLGLMGEEIKQQGFDVQTLNMNSGVPDVRVIPKLVNIVRDWKPDIFHSHMVHANLLARIVRLFTPDLPALICTAQNIDESEGQKWRDVAYRVTDRFCDVTTNVTKAGVERYVNIGLVPEHKIQFIPNSVDSLTYSPDADIRKSARNQLGIDNQFVWLAVGRFYLQKDYPTMILAFSKVLQQKADSLLIIAGEGVLQPQIQEMVKNMNIQDSVKFLGPRRDIPDLMRAADAQVMSSAWEGMPLVLLEAASVGLPIVSTDVGGVAETIIPGETGYLVPPKDPSALANSMLQMMNLPDSTRRTMGANGRQYVAKYYSTENIAQKWEDLYYRFLAIHP